MPDQFEVGMPNPVTNCGLGTSEAVIKDVHVVAKEHKAIDEMGTDEACATCHQDTLSLTWREELNRRKAREGGVRNGLVLWVINGFGLVC